MALLTTSYDPQKGTAFVGDIIKLAASMEESRARMEEQKRQHDEQTMQQTLADQRRSFEFDRRLEFERARTATDDARADSRLALEKQDREPFTVPGAATSPSAGVPALPSSGSSDGVQGTVFGLVPDGKGGYMDDPQDSIDSAKGIPGYDPNKGAYGANIKDPSLKGVALTPADMRAAGVDPNNPSTHEVEVTANGKTMRYPIVDKLGTPGKLDLTYGAFKEMGGPDSPSGSIAGLKYRVVPKGGGEAAEGAAEPPSKQIATLAREIAGTGLFDKKEARTILTSAASSLLSRKPASEKPPMVRNTPAGFEQYDPATNTWNVVRAKPAGAVLAQTKEEATTGMDYNADHDTFISPSGGEFFAHQTTKGWLLRPYKPTTDKPSKWMTGSDGQPYPLDGKGNPLKPVPEGVTLRDNSRLQLARTQGGGTMIVDPDGTARQLIPDGVKVDAKTQDAYREAAQDFRAAQTSYEREAKLLQDNPSKTGVSWFGGGTQSSVDAAKKKMDDAQQRVEGLRKDFPALAPARDTSSVYQDEQAARAAGAKAGDVVMVVNPKTGKPGRFQLQ